MDTTNGSFSRTWAELLLAAVILARSTSYVMTKIGLQGMAPFSLLGIRFITAFLFLLPLGWRRLKSASAGTWLRLLGVPAEPLLQPLSIGRLPAAGREST